MSKKKKRRLTILDLDFISILDRRPVDGQFILLAWDINGYCGYESTTWDTEDKHCQHGVAWFPLPETHLYTKNCSLVLRKNNKHKTTAPILKWSSHFSRYANDKYMNRKREVYEQSYCERSVNE